MGEGVGNRPLQHAEYEQHKAAAPAEHHRERQRPHHPPPVPPVGDGLSRGAVRGPLSEPKPQPETEHHTKHDCRRTRRERHAKRHEQRKRRHDEGEPDQPRESPGQHDEPHPDERHTNGDRHRIHTRLASQLVSVGERTAWDHHARNAIRFVSREVSGHHTVVLLALLCAVAARAGSEFASRFAIVRLVAAQFSAPFAALPMVSSLWWVLGTAIATAMAVATARALTSHRGAHPRTCRRLLAATLVVFAAHGALQWQRLASPRVGEFSGVVIARSDAAARNNAVSLIVEVEGENFRLTLRGRARSALQRVRMGDVLLIDATRVAYDERKLRFVAGRHVQGELQQTVLHATAPSPAPWHRAANRVHDIIDRGSRTMQRDDAALVRGLVLGDESRQPTRMTEAFRAAGLGHLLAVSGQNVVLVLAALTPGLRRLSRWPRLATALGVVGMFAIVTRLESSVVRACVMAAITQVGYAIGRDLVPLRALALTVVGIVALDPLATWSIGFVLSVAATAGLIVITPLLGKSVFAASAAAQLAVAPFVVWWFGSMPSLALLTNVLAVPAASLVMVIGPPILAVAAFLPDTVAVVLTTPVVAAVRWVWWVAEWGLRLSLPAWVNLAAWAVILLLVVRRIVHEVRYVGHPRARL